MSSGSQLKDNKIMLLEEDFWCVHKYLDDLGLPRTDKDGKEYSIVGRIKRLEEILAKNIMTTNIEIHEVPSIDLTSTPFLRTTKERLRESLCNIDLLEIKINKIMDTLDRVSYDLQIATEVIRKQDMNNSAWNSVEGWVSAAVRILKDCIENDYELDYLK